MGRFVYENGTCIWKYVFGMQESEQYRISEEYDIGVYSLLEPEYDEDEFHDGEITEDCLVLRITDVEKIDEILEENNFDKLKEEHMLLTKQYSGVECYLVINGENTIISPYEVQLTVDELKEKYKDDAKYWTYSFNCPYSAKLKDFINNNEDYYLFAMMYEYSKYMKKVYEEEKREEFAFEGDR